MEEKKQRDPIKKEDQNGNFVKIINKKHHPRTTYIPPVIFQMEREGEGEGEEDEGSDQRP